MAHLRACLLARKHVIGCDGKNVLAALNRLARADGVARIPCQARQRLGFALEPAPVSYTHLTLPTTPYV